MKKLIIIITTIFLSTGMSFSNAHADSAGDHTIENIFIVTSAAALGTALIYSLNTRDDDRHHQRGIHHGKYHHRWAVHKKPGRWKDHHPGYAHRYRHDQKRYSHYNGDALRGYREPRGNWNKNSHRKKAHNGMGPDRNYGKTNQHERGF